jgi:hypothetical protein
VCLLAALAASQPYSLPYMAFGHVNRGAMISTAFAKAKGWSVSMSRRLTARAAAGPAPAAPPAVPSAGYPAAEPQWLLPGSQSPPHLRGQGCTHLHPSQAGSAAAVTHQQSFKSRQAGTQAGRQAHDGVSKQRHHHPHSPSRGLAAVLWNSSSSASRSLPASARSDRRLGGARRVRPRKRSKSFSRSNTSRLR